MHSPLSEFSLFQRPHKTAFFAQQHCKIPGGQWFAKKISLHLVAPAGGEQVMLLPGLNAFGYRLEAETVRDGNDAFTQGGAIAAFGHVIDE